MKNYKSKIVKVTAFQFKNDITSLSAITEKFNAEINIFENSMFEYDGQIFADGWIRCISYGDWIVIFSPEETPQIMSDEDFKELFEVI